MRLPAIESRLGELLADRALLGLSEPEAAELRSLLRDEPGVDEWALDRAATALFVGLSGLQIEAPPASVRGKLDRAGGDWVAARTPAVSDRSLHAAPEVVSRVGRASSAFAWMAAAACLALALVAWWPRGSVARRNDVIAQVVEQPDAVHITWAPGPDETGRGVSGEVVWSDSAQAGFMEFRGLPPLDPKRWQYQLWIVDPARDKHPVDGGVFDVPAAGNGALVRVPIDAKLRVDKPAAFVVTVERPGGVVVSGQERVALIAAAGG